MPETQVEGAAYPNSLRAVRAVERDRRQLISLGLVRPVAAPAASLGAERAALDTIEAVCRSVAQSGWLLDVATVTRTRYHRVTSFVVNVLEG
jgi:hypothetical protein